MLSLLLFCKGLISKKIVLTVAGNHKIKPRTRNNPQEKDPLKLNLPKISSLDYSDNCLFVPEWDGDMVVLEKVKRTSR